MSTGGIAIQKLVEEVAESLDADVLMYAGDIDVSAFRVLHKKVRARKLKRINVLFFLTTQGGDPDAAYQIARLLQSQYKNGRLILLIDTFCKSSGTLIATGAHEIVMTDRANWDHWTYSFQSRISWENEYRALAHIHALNTLAPESFRTFEHCMIRIRVNSRFQITTVTAAQIDRGN